MSKRYENLQEAMCKELEKLDKKYGGEVAEMTVQDAEKADMLYHALKSAETYHAMADEREMESEEMEGSGDGRGYRGNYGRSYNGGRSYARRRDSMGRYISRDMGGYSGHYPMMYPQYPMSYDMGDWRY